MHAADFAPALARALPLNTIVTGAPATRLESNGVLLADGAQVAARAVIDCRGLEGSCHLAGGWQVFLGRQLRLGQPHGLCRPTIMDARVAQEGGYRFLYVLPLGPCDLFVEDTYYQDTPRLERSVLSGRLDAYARRHGWHGTVVAEETGVLPVITGGDFTAFQAEQSTPGVAVAGARGGFVHPLTSYTLPFAVRTALLVAEHADLPGEQLAALLAKEARRHWEATRLYRLLGAMLMGAAEPAKRYRVFERFYALPERLIERFYAARSTRRDSWRILAGKPPVRIGRAMAALLGSRPPLVAGPLAEPVR
jgi:lycopene beta-cyclase